MSNTSNLLSTLVGKLTKPFSQAEAEPAETFGTQEMAVNRRLEDLPVGTQPQAHVVTDNSSSSSSSSSSTTADYSCTSSLDIESDEDNVNDNDNTNVNDNATESASLEQLSTSLDDGGELTSSEVDSIESASASDDDNDNANANAAQGAPPSRTRSPGPGSRRLMRTDNRSSLAKMRPMFPLGHVTVGMSKRLIVP